MVYLYRPSEFAVNGKHHLGQQVGSPNRRLAAMIAATGNQRHSKDLISMNRKLLNVVAIASLILPIRIAAADSLNARPGRWTITRTYVRGPGPPTGVVRSLPR